MSSTPEILLIGHTCHDLHQGEYLLGGTASYASILTSRLGHKTAVLTSFGPDFKFIDRLESEGIQLISKPSSHTTIFENLYLGEHRTQFMHQRAAQLTADDLPKEWKSIPVVLLGPIADEIDASLVAAFPESLVGATIQGWLRHVNNQKEVKVKAMDWVMIQHLDIVFVSEEDLGNLEGALEQIIQKVKTVVLTDGPGEVKIFTHNKVYNFPAFSVDATDPTGAGDIFAVAFLVHFAKFKDLALATAYAHAAASLIVENRGIRVPDLMALEKRYQLYINQFLKR